jgi:hypothetical protein
MKKTVVCSPVNAQFLTSCNNKHISPNDNLIHQLQLFLHLSRKVMFVHVKKKYSVVDDATRSAEG